MADLKKIISLIKKTGDKLLILDENGEPSGIFMTIDDYEKLAVKSENITNLTKEDVFDRINRDIGVLNENRPEPETIGQILTEMPDFSEKKPILADLSQSSFGPGYFHLENGKSVENKPDFDENRIIRSSGLSELDNDHYYFEPVE